MKKMMSRLQPDINILSLVISNNYISSTYITLTSNLNLHNSIFIILALLMYITNVHRLKFSYLKTIHLFYIIQPFIYTIAIKYIDTIILHYLAARAEEAHQHLGVPLAHRMADEAKATAEAHIFTSKVVKDTSHHRIITTNCSITLLPLHQVWPEQEGSLQDIRPHLQLLSVHCALLSQPGRALRRPCEGGVRPGHHPFKLTLVHLTLALA